ncbi:MAG: CopG family transcriptional regulator [Candidatus Omnitrophota bacterium]
MRKKTLDFDMPMGKLTRVKDLLPSPADLVISEETKKITISLKKSSIDFFKRQAARYHTKYQRMIRELVDRYALQYSKN